MTEGLVYNMCSHMLDDQHSMEAPAMQGAFDGDRHHPMVLVVRIRWQDCFAPSLSFDDSDAACRFSVSRTVLTVRALFGKLPVARTRQRVCNSCATPARSFSGHRSTQSFGGHMYLLMRILIELVRFKRRHSLRNLRGSATITTSSKHFVGTLLMVAMTMTLTLTYAHAFIDRQVMLASQWYEPISIWLKPQLRFPE